MCTQVCLKGQPLYVSAHQMIGAGIHWPPTSMYTVHTYFRASYGQDGGCFGPWCGYLQLGDNHLAYRNDQPTTKAITSHTWHQNLESQYLLLLQLCHGFKRPTMRPSRMVQLVERRIRFSGMVTLILLLEAPGPSTSSSLAILAGGSPPRHD